MSGQEEKKKGVVPRLRFPEFRDVGEWGVKRLGKICDILNNQRKPITSTDRENGPYPYYGASGVVDYINDYIFNERLLLVGEDGAKWGAYENTAFIVEGKYWVNNHAHVLKAKTEKANDIFLENYFTKLDVLPYVTGAAPPKLTLDNLKNIPIPLPERISEQQRIANCLSSLDELIAAEAQKLDALKRHKKGLMQQLFPREGETVPRLRFPEFRDAGEWEVKQLGDISEFVNDKILLDELSIDNYISTENLLPDFSGITVARKLPTYGSVTKFKKNDILLANIRPYLKKVWLSNKDGGASNDVIVIRTREGGNSRYLAFALMTDKFIGYVMQGAKGVKMPRGDLVLIKKYSLAVPPSLEQQKIADCLSSLDELITTRAQKIETLKQYKKGLMQQLFPAMDEVNE